MAAGCIQDRMQIEAFAPCHYFVRKTRTGKKRFLEAIFPCYIFVYCDIRPNFRQILSMNGVRSIVHYGNTIPPVNDSLIDGIRRELDAHTYDHPEPELMPGAKVEVVSGPFASCIANVLTCPDSAQRVACLMNILGQDVVVKLSQNDLMVCQAQAC
jgi:transcription antitermination factor NusG